MRRPPGGERARSVGLLRALSLQILDAQHRVVPQFAPYVETMTQLALTGDDSRHMTLVFGVGKRRASSEIK